MQRYEERVLPGGGRIEQGVAMELIAKAQTLQARLWQTPLQNAYLVRLLARKGRGRTLTHAGQWLTAHQRTIAQQADALAHVLHKVELPVLRQGVFAGYARIYALMALCVLQNGGTADEAAMRRTLMAYRRYGELTLLEIRYAVPMARLAMLELCGALAQDELNTLQAADSAQKIARRLRRGRTDGASVPLFALVGGDAFAVHLQRSLCACRPHTFLQFSQRAAFALDTTAPGANRRYLRTIQQKNAQAHSAIKGLRALCAVAYYPSLRQSSMAWNLCVQDRDFRRLSEDTQAAVCREIGLMALAAGVRESDVVRAALDGAQHLDGPLLTHALLGGGRRALLARLGLRKRIPRNGWHLGQAATHALPFFLAVLILCATLRAHAPVLEVLGGTFFGYVIVAAACNRCFAFCRHHLQRTLPLPRLRCAPCDAPVVVALPVLTAERERIDACLRALTTASFAFAQARRYVLLCDFPDDSRPHGTADAALYAHAREKVEQYNRQYGTKFALLTRARTMMPREGKWMGKDRRQGQLQCLHAVLRGKAPQDVRWDGAPVPAGIELVLLLDEGTLPPAGEAQKLLCTLLHPQNAGIGFVQPRMAVDDDSLACSALNRLYAPQGYLRHPAQRASAAPGLPLTRVQGMYRMEQWERAAQMLPLNELLQPDEALFFLCNGRTCQDVQFVLSFPTRYTARAKRVHRHARALWQLLPLAAGTSRKGGRYIRLPGAMWWRVATLLTDSFAPLATTQLLAIATFSALPFAFYLLLALFPYAVDVLLALGEGALETCVPGRPAFWVWPRRLLRAVSDVILCAYDASFALDAALRTLYGGFVQKRGYLLLMTAEHAARGDARTLLGYVRQMTPALIFNGVVVVFVYLQKPQHFLAVLALVALWGLSPLWAVYLDERRTARSAPQDETLPMLAQRMWEGMAPFLQRAPHLLPAWAEGEGLQGASQTHAACLGASLMAPLCAHALGLIDPQEAARLSTQTLQRIWDLPKWQGHCYNWVSLLEKRPVQGAHASLDASGVLAACLLLAEQALLELDAPAAARQAWQLASSTDFAALYDEQNGLFCLHSDDPSHLRLRPETGSVAAHLAVGLSQVQAQALCELVSVHGGKRACAAPLSRTGSLFCYGLPLLFWPASRHTRLARMARSALRAQRREAGRRAFGACAYVDRAGGLRHDGAPALSLYGERMDGGLQPAASLLSLCFCEKTALSNLRRLQREGARARYGYPACVQDGAPGPWYDLCANGLGLLALTLTLAPQAVRRWSRHAPALCAVLPILCAQ